MSLEFHKLISNILPKGSTSRDSVLIVLGDGLKFASNLVALMILARIIPVDVMATYRQIIYIGPLAISIVEFGLSSSIYRFWNVLNQKERSSYIKMVILLSVLLGGIASIALAILAPFLAVWYDNPDLKTALLICCAYPLTNIVTLSIRPLMINKGKSPQAIFIQLVFSLAMMGAIIIPLYFKASLNQALIYWMIINFIEMIITFIILNHEILPETPWWSKKTYKDLRKYLWPIQAGRVSGVFTGYIDKITTSVYLNAEEFAVYSLGAREIPFIGQIGYSISSVMIPKLVTYIESGRIEDVCGLWKRAIKRTSLIIYPIIGFCIYFSKPIVRFLFSATYIESSVPFAVYSLLTFIRVVEYASLAKAYGKTEIIMKGAVLGSIIMIILSFPLTSLLGTWGILITLLLSTYISNGFYLYSYTKLLNKPLKDFYPIKHLLILATISVIIPAFVGRIFNPIIYLSTTVSFFSIGIKLVFLFLCCLILYLICLILSGKLQFKKLLKLFKK